MMISFKYDMLIACDSMGDKLRRTPLSEGDQNAQLGSLTMKQELIRNRSDVNRFQVREGESANGDVMTYVSLQI